MPDRPNILILVSEQHRGDCLGCEGHPVLLTPNMDAIGGAGVRFRRAYSTCPVCIPARRSLLSGQFPATHGIQGYINAEWQNEQTLGTLFRDGGYQTAWVGRSMHQAPPRKRFGFEEMILSDYRLPDDDYREFLARNMPEGGGGYYGGGVMHNDWTARPFHLPEELHHTNWTIHEAQRFLDRRDTTRPFLLVVSFLAAHPPLVPPAFYFERYLRTGVPEPIYGDWAEPPANDGVGAGPAPARVHLTGEALLSARAGYYGLINHLDDQIRRLLNGILGGVNPRETVTLFTSDHGEMLGDHYLWRKSVPYEGSARVPLLLYTPPRFGLAPGRVIDEPVCLEDILPTLLELAELPIPAGVEGRSLLPLLRGGTGKWRPFLHIECAPLHHTLTDGREKYVWFVADGREQFFRLTDDPTELHDLARVPGEAERIAFWRNRLIGELVDRPEGFTDGRSLVPGQAYPGISPPRSGRK